MLRRALLLTALVALPGCLSLPTLSPEPPPQIRLANDGLRPTGTDLRIDFGRDSVGVVAAVTRLLGAEPASSVLNPECGAGPLAIVQWDAGLTLLFTDGDFAGWVADSPAFVTVTGYTTGMTRQALQEAGVTGFQQTTLGTEFDLGGIWGLFAESGTQVDTLWAGTSCFFR